MRINTNMAALNAWRSMTTNAGNMQKSLEKLSSGFRINRAADDAAGLAVSEKMRAQIRGTNQSVRNAQDGISLVQTAEGALTETHNILQRMRELSVQASTGTLNTDDTKAVQEEIKSLTTEIDRIANSTKFNDKALLTGGIGNTITATDPAFTTKSVTAGKTNLVASGVQEIVTNGAKSGTYTITITAGTTGSDIEVKDAAGNMQTLKDVVAPAAGQYATANFDKLGVSLKLNELFSSTSTASTKTFDVNKKALSVQVSANNDSTYGNIDIDIADMTSAASGLNIAGLNVESQNNAKSAIDSLDAAIKTVSTQRAKLGATQNRLEHTVSNLQVTSENLSAAESRVRDVDMAQEMSTFTKNNILQQASQAMLAQANQSTQGILQLLR